MLTARTPPAGWLAAAREQLPLGCLATQTNPGVCISVKGSSCHVTKESFAMTTRVLGAILHSPEQSSPGEQHWTGLIDTQGERTNQVLSLLLPYPEGSRCAVHAQ